MFTEFLSLLTRAVVAVETIANNPKLTVVAAAPAPEKPKAAPKKTTTKETVAPPPVVETLPAVEDDFGDATPETPVTLDMLKELLPALAAKDKEKAKQIILTVGNAPNISSVDPKNYGAVLAAFKSLLAA